MTDWRLYKDLNSDFYDKNRAIKMIAFSFEKLRIHWANYISSEYSDYENENNIFLDFSEISRFIISLKIKNETSDFDSFFSKIEKVFFNCDSETEDILITGLLESIQNNALDKNINITTEFDKWLQPRTKKNWDNLIDFWNGKIKRKFELTPE